MTLLTIALLIAMVIRRTKLAVMVSVATLAGEVVLSGIFQMGEVDETLWITGLCILLVLACALHWKNNNNDVSKYITGLAFLASCLSFAKLTIHGVIFDLSAYAMAQGFITQLVDGLTVAAIACLLLLPDKPVFLHDLATNIRHGATWIRDSVYLFSNKGH